jgi:alanine racemase
MHVSSGRPTVAHIDGGALRHNLAAIRNGLAHANVALLAVVKADAYGHGAALVAPLLEPDVEAFGVATVEEAIELRTAGVRKPILVLAGASGSQLESVLANQLSVALVDRSMLAEWRAALRGRRLTVHLKIDTGMGRLGVTPAELPALLEDLRLAPEIVVAGIFSHFANANLSNADIYAFQLQQFQQALATAAAAGVRPGFIHLANSTGALARPTSHFTMVRPGVALYGIAPLADCPVALAPAMRLVTRIIQLKFVAAERPLSYGQTFITRRPSRIATIPIGYADGYDRRLSNRGFVLVRGQRAPIVGLVCMDLTLIDVTDIAGVESHDEVVLWGTQGAARISVEEVASWQDSIAYEVLTRLGKRVPRVLHDDGVGRNA